MKILSLFGGIECGRVALKNLGVTPTHYFSSEVNRNAIKIVRQNFPNITHLGDIRNINTSDLPPIDIILAGFPCTDLSRAGKQNGFYGVDSLEQYLDLKRRNHKFKGQSYLFWEFVRLLKELQPKYFLLENVIMPQKWRRLIDRTLGMQAYPINSAAFSSQSRERLYWTNIEVEPFYKFSHLVVEDVLDCSVDYGWLDGTFVRVGSNSHERSNSTRRIGGLLPDEGGSETIFKSHQRVYSIRGKAPTLVKSNGAIFKMRERFRRLTILEKERLQGLPDHYTRVGGMSDGPREVCIGNGWTVGVIEHLLKGLVR